MQWLLRGEGSSHKFAFEVIKNVNIVQLGSDPAATMFYKDKSTR